MSGSPLEIYFEPVLRLVHVVLVPLPLFVGRTESAVERVHKELVHAMAMLFVVNMVHQIFVYAHTETGLDAHFLKTLRFAKNAKQELIKERDLLIKTVAAAIGRANVGVIWCTHLIWG